MIALYLALLNGFTPDIKRTHIIDETFVQNNNKRKNIKENFMDNAKGGWIGRVFPIIVLISLITVIVVGLYECTLNKAAGF